MSKQPAQSVKFTSVAQCLAFLPPDELAITEALRALVYNCVPHIREKLSFQVPFFHHHTALCFIWPGSIDWMGKSTPGKVQFGFTKGHLLNDRWGYMHRGNRTMIITKDFYRVDEINMEVLTELLYEAAALNEELYLEKKGRR
jgi:hypothetical protein